MTSRHTYATKCGCLFIAIAFFTTSAAAQLVSAPDRRADEGAGPFDSLLIKNAIVINGTGSPPIGPTNIWVKQNRIEKIGGGKEEDADHVVDATGMYVLPGFIDMHAHCGSSGKAPQAEYVYKLWMGHGITSVRGVPLGRNDWTLKEQERSEKNEIVAPRIFNYQRPPGNLKTPEEAREWVRKAPLDGIQGLKLGSYRPPIMKALLEEAKRLKMGSVAHLGQMGVAHMNAMDSARLGLQSVTHYYGHFEALMKDHAIQPWPHDQNYMDEQNRFAQVARLWDKIHPPGSPEWKAYLKEHLELGTVFNPTLTIYSAGRDVMRARTAEWHDAYTIPSLWKYFQPSRRTHGSYWYDWTTEDEVEWRNFYQVWFRLLNDYKKMGGRVTAGADAGFIYDTFGFGYIEELELLQEAGFHPLEVIQAATYNPALTLYEPKGEPHQLGEIREGLFADLIVLPENPLQNLKTLYATGAVRLNDETGIAERVGGVRWTIKDGIVYDAHQLLADVREMVRQEKEGVDDTAANPPTTGEKPANPTVTSARVAPASKTSAKKQEPRPENVGDTNLLIAVASDKKSAWGFSNEGEWVHHSFDNDAGVQVRQNSNDSLGWILVADKLFAFSATTGTWSELKIRLPLEENVLAMRANVITVKTGKTISAFSAKKGEWVSIDVGNGK